MSAFLTSRKKAAAAELADWMQSPEGQASSLESIGRSLSRRNHGRSRAVVLAHDHDEAIKGLRAVAAGKQAPNVFSVDGPVTTGPVWVLAGFGAQHRKMGKSLYLRNEVFAAWIEKVDALVQDELGYSVLELILDDAQDYGIETTQVTIFAIQIALVSCCAITAPNRPRSSASRWVRPRRPTSPAGCRCGMPPGRSARART